MELHRVPNYSLTINRNKKTLPNTQSTYNVLKVRSYNKEYFDRFSFLDIYHFGGIHVLHEYISVNDHDYSFRVLRDFYLNYNLCEFDHIVPESLRYSNGTIRSRYDIDTLFQIIIQFIHYGDMYLIRKKNIYFGGANQMDEAIEADAARSLFNYNTLDAIADYCNEKKTVLGWDTDELISLLNEKIQYREKHVTTVIDLAGNISCFTMAKGEKIIPLLSIFLANIILDGYHDHKELFQSIKFVDITDCMVNILLKKRKLTHSHSEIVKNITTYIELVVQYYFYRMKVSKLSESQEEEQRSHLWNQSIYEARKVVVLDDKKFQLPSKIDIYHYDYLFAWLVSLKETNKLSLPPIGNWRLSTPTKSTASCVFDQYSNPNGGFLLNSGNVELNVPNAIDPGKTFRKGIYPKEYIDALLHNIYDKQKKYIIDTSSYQIHFDYKVTNKRPLANTKEESRKKKRSKAHTAVSDLHTSEYMGESDHDMVSETEQNELFSCLYEFEDNYTLQLFYNQIESITNNNPPFLDTVYSRGMVTDIFSRYYHTLKKPQRIKINDKPCTKTNIQDILLSSIIRKFMGDFGQMLYCSIPNLKMVHKENGSDFINFSVHEDGDKTIISNEDELENYTMINTEGKKIFITGDRAAVNSSLLLTILQIGKPGFNTMNYGEGIVGAHNITTNSNIVGDFFIFNVDGVIDISQYP